MRGTPTVDTTKYDYDQFVMDVTQIRKKNKLFTTDVSEVLGCSPSTVSRIEGYQVISQKKFEEICQNIGKTTDDYLIKKNITGRLREPLCIYLTQHGITPQAFATSNGIPAEIITKYIKGDIKNLSRTYLVRIAKSIGEQIDEEKIEPFDYERLRKDMKIFLQKNGMSQKEFARSNCIPLKTVNDFLTETHVGAREETARKFCDAIGTKYDNYIQREKEDVAKTPESKIDITEVYKVVDEVVRDCLEKTFERFLEKHFGEYKRRRGWTLQ